MGFNDWLVCPDCMAPAKRVASAEDGSVLVECTDSENCGREEWIE